MTQIRKSIIIGILGILFFCTGAGLRLQAAHLSTFEMKFDMEGKPLKDHPNYNGQKCYIKDSDRMEAITGISSVLIWSGGSLVVLSLGVWLFSKEQNPVRSWE